MSGAEAFDACIAAGGVALFPSDTVYGLACDPGNERAVQRLYALKGRAPDKPSAVMFFALEHALAALPGLGERVRGAVARILPGPVGVLVPNPAGAYPLACVGDPATLGVRVPLVPALAQARAVVLQSSANLSGGPDPRRLEDVPAALRRGADLCLDGGELPGTASTIVDLRGYEETGSWSLVRAGAVPESRLRELLGAGPPS